MVKRKRNESDLERKFTKHQQPVREQVRRRVAVTTAPRTAVQPSPTSADHPIATDDDRALLKALGTTDPNFVKGLFGQLIRANARGADKIDGEGLWFTHAVIQGLKPRDEAVAMQLAQMAAVHAALIKLSGEAARATDLARRDSAICGMSLLARTYTAQLEGLKRYCAGAGQKVTVHNVSVTEGGQAIVGNVTQATPGATPDKLANTPQAITDARQTAMEIIGEPQRVSVPLRAKPKT
jgi:hypothetical protein